MLNEADATERAAEAILDMTYDELMAVADTLRDMNDDSPRNLKDTREWAELLNSWAKGVGFDAE